MSDELGTWLESAKQGDHGALARLLTRLEREGWPLVNKLKLFDLPRPALRIGITGPPGAGKSTLVGQLIRQIRAQQRRLAILAVDPSSPFSSGAILGDRIRYNETAVDPDLFIRSLGSRGSLGGLSAAAYLMLRALDAVSFDIVLIETVGVGQTELEVMNVADVVVVVLVPESGDSIQAMKAGLMEIANIFVVNKSDRPGAESLKRELEALGSAKVISTVATDGQGLSALQNELGRIEKTIDRRANRQSPARLKQEGLSLARLTWESQVRKKLDPVRTEADLFQILGALSSF